MKRFVNLAVCVLAFLVFLPAVSLFAQKATPQVPVTYPGDTPETIKRRAQWIEGAKKEGTLTWWGGLSPKLAKTLIAEFNRLYPFISVDYWNAPGEEKSAKMETEHAAGRYTVDILLGGETYNYPRWRKMGLLEKFVDIVPGVKKLDKRMYSKNGDYFVSYHTVVTPQYNTKLVSASDAPKGWEDLLAPKWKGHIGITSDLKVWTVLAAAEGGWGVEKTEDFLRKLSQQNIIWGRGHTGHHALMITGEYKVNAEGYVYHALQSKKKGAPVEWIRADPVVVLGPSTAFMKHSPHPNAARLFLEWHFSPQGVLALDKVTGSGAAYPGSGTQQSKALEGLNFVDRTEEVQLKIIDLSLEKKFANILGVKPE